MSVMRRVLAGLHGFIGIGAIGGGIGALVDPSGAAVGLDASVLQRGPFTDFLIPGLFLVIVLGLGNIVAVALLLSRHRRVAGLASLGLFAVLVLWIVIQVLIMGLSNAVWLHWLFLLFGLVGSVGTTVWICTEPRVDEVETPRLTVGWTHLFAGQVQHALLLAVLVPGALYLAEAGFTGGSWLGLRDRQWLALMLSVAILHQIVVAAVFRMHLVFSFLTRLFGRWDLFIWGSIFLPFLVLRLLTLAGLAMSTRGTLVLSRIVAAPVSLILLIPAAYTLYSVFRWFGLTRALGGDHFRQRYLEMPFERRGAFRFSSNAMYSYAFLVLWAVALVTRSHAALAAALFQHAYIWVHWYCTEEPDMRVLYE
ncbi:MAG: methyltransferase [Spirochaetota bacterium]